MWCSYSGLWSSNGTTSGYSSTCSTSPTGSTVQPVQPQVASTQATTAQHKKTTYVEAYLEPVDAQVPLMQPTVSKKVVEKKTYPVSDEIVYVEQKPLKNSTMQDYNLYLMENEYYSMINQLTKKLFHHEQELIKPH